MSEVVDLRSVDLGMQRLDRIFDRRRRWFDSIRELARTHITNAFDEAEAGLDMCAELRRGGQDITPELDEAEGTLKAFLLQVQCLRGNHE